MTALVYLLVWLSLAAYALAQSSTLRAARWYAVGCVLMVLHILAAMIVVHHGSHAAALEHVAARTATLTGWRWGGGLYVNYAFALAWCLDALDRLHRAERGQLLESVARKDLRLCVFLPMIVSATVLFGSPWGRLGGVVLLAWIVLQRRRRASALHGG